MHWKNIDNYGRSSKMFLDQQVIAQTIITRNTWKLDSTQIII